MKPSQYRHEIYNYIKRQYKATAQLFLVVALVAFINNLAGIVFPLFLSALFAYFYVTFNNE